MKQFTKYLLFVSIVVFTSCSVQRKLEKSTLGKSMYEVVEEKGKPHEIRNLRDGGKLYIYKDFKSLRSVPINTGEYQYEKLKSSAMVRQDVIYITFSPDGKATEIKKESGYL